MGESINATKGISQGEDIWLTVRQDFDKVGIGFNHFLVYFTQRMYWGGKSADVDAMFREYCRLFYGPAEAGDARLLRLLRSELAGDGEGQGEGGSRARAVRRARRRRPMPRACMAGASR